MNEEKILLELKYIKDQLASIIKGLRGIESDENRPGLFLRVDRLEQSKKTHTHILWTIITGGITVMATVLGALLVRYFI